jgi:hypothetical protein
MGINVSQKKINFRTLKIRETCSSETLEELTPYTSQPVQRRPEILRPSIKYVNQYIFLEYCVLE